MATFTVGGGDIIRPYRNQRIRNFPEAPSQTFKIGDPVILNTTADKGQQVKIAAADPVLGTVVGFAAEAASGVEGTSIGVWLFTEENEMLVAVQDTGVLDNDQIGVEYGIVADGTNLIWRLDLTETSVKVFRVLEIAPGYAHGDVNGKLIVKPAYGAAKLYGS